MEVVALLNVLKGTKMKRTLSNRYKLLKLILKEKSSSIPPIKEDQGLFNPIVDSPIHFKDYPEINTNVE